MESLEENQEKTIQITDSATKEPQNIFFQKELQSVLLKALSKLSLEHLEVVTLHHIENFSLQEIANILSIPEGTIKSRLARARESLKKELSNYVLA